MHKEDKKNTSELLIGIDLGGTNVRVGAYSMGGDLILFKERPIEASKGPEYGLETIYTLIGSVMEKVNQPVAAIGIGSTGPLDRERGCIQNPYTLPGWEDVDIVSPLVKKYGVPVTLENDADAAALGESWMGAGKGAQRFVMVTIGTGVGFAFVINGKLYRGMGGEHPEGGHVLVDPSGPVCYCGAHGCLESLVSGPAIAAYAQTLASDQGGFLTQQTNGDRSQINASLVFAGARKGDKPCQVIVDKIAEYIGLGLVSIIMLTLPDRIVLTGGVLRSYDLLEPGIKRVIQRHNLMIPTEKVALYLAALGQTAGMVGAARAAQMKFQETSL